MASKSDKEIKVTEISEKLETKSSKDKTKKNKKNRSEDPSNSGRNKNAAKRARKAGGEARANNQKLACILTPQENKLLTEYMMNILEPVKPFKLARPVPSRTVACAYAGEIRFDSKAEYVEIKARPEPKALIDITTQLGSSAFLEPTGPVQNMAQLVTNPNVSVVFSPEQWICMELPLEINGGSRIRAENIADLDTSTGEIVSAIDGLIAPVAKGFSGIGINEGAVFGVNVVNNSARTIQYTPRVLRVVAGNNQPQVLATGFANTVGPNGGATMTVTVPDAYPYQANSRLIFAVGCKTTTSGTTAPWRTQEFQPTFEGFTAEDVYTTTTYTLGEAVYGKGHPNALVLDAFFDECYLWSPVAMSTRLNVKIKVNEYGGMFQAAYLPSYIIRTLSSEPSVAWQQIAGYKRSYPVRETDFKDGSHATWVGARIQDYEFRHPLDRVENYAIEEASMPWTSLTAQKASSDAVGRYYVNFLVAFEVQTLNPLVTATLGPGEVQFMQQFLAFVSANDNLVGENPAHIDRLRKMVSAALKDPRVRDAGKWLLRTGVPLLMSAIG